MIIFISVIIAASGVSSYQICGTSRGTIFLEPPTLRNCSSASAPDTNEKIEHFLTDIYVQRLKPVTASTFVCNKVITVLSVYNPFIGENQVFNRGITYDDVDVDECVEMIDVAFKGAQPSTSKPWTNLTYHNKTKVRLL